MPTALRLATLRQRDDTAQLNQVFRIPKHQPIFVNTAKGDVVTKTLIHPSKAVLYQRQYTLYAEFVAASLSHPIMIPPLPTRPIH